MEKFCEFCQGPSPVIYCKADAAHLCLSCDAKVHSANALSNRHLRTLLCCLCRNFPTYMRCLDHKMFLCRGCDLRLHNASSRHQRKKIGSFTGCPSAKDFAMLWGFDLDELSKLSQDQFFPKSCESANSSVINLDIPGRSCSQVISPSPVARSNSRQSEKPFRGEEQNFSVVLQQILELNSLQLSEENNGSSLIRGQEKTYISSSIPHSSKKHDEAHVNQTRYSGDPDTDVEQSDNLRQDLKGDVLPFQFSPLEHLSSSAAAFLPSQGDFLSQCKSPYESSQLWSQNMPEMGACDEFLSHDDFDIPDVDLTFQNFEDLFKSDQDPVKDLFEDKDSFCSSMEKDMSLDNLQAKGKEDVSVALATHVVHSVHMDKDIDASDQVLSHSGKLESPRPIQPSYSTLSIPNSWFSADSPGSDGVDSGLLLHTVGERPPCNSPDLKHEQMGTGDSANIRRFKKRKSRLHDKQTQCCPRKARTDVQKRIKGRFAKEKSEWLQHSHFGD